MCLLTSEEACAEAIKQFNGRYYAGKQLSCEFCPVEKWKTAICGEFLKQGERILCYLSQTLTCIFLSLPP